MKKRHLKSQLVDLGILIDDCGRVADTLEKSISTHVACNRRELEERTEGVARVLRQTLTQAANAIFDLYDKVERSAGRRPPDEMSMTRVALPEVEADR